MTDEDQLLQKDSIEHPFRNITVKNADTISKPKGDDIMDKNHGIHCSVESCVYNKDCKECTAPAIDVSGTCQEPGCCDETVCKTFEARD